MRSLTPKQLAFFRRHGYVVLARHSGAGEVRALRSICDRSFTRRGRKTDGVIHERDPAGVLVSDKLVQPELEYPDLVRAPFFVSARRMAEQALRARGGAESILMFLSKPGGAPPTPWHQDENTKPPHIAEQVTFWMPLEPVDERNGTLAFVPDTHRGECIPHDAYCTIPDGLVDPGRVMTCALRPGDAILIHGRVIHGATANATRKRRRVAFIYFFRLVATPTRGTAVRRRLRPARRRAG